MLLAGAGLATYSVTESDAATIGEAANIDVSEPTLFINYAVDNEELWLSGVRIYNP